MVRWISGIIVACVVVLLLLFFPMEWVQVTVVLLSMLGLREFFNLTQKGVSAFIRTAGIVLCGTTCALLVFWARTPDHFLAIFAGIIIITFIVHMTGSTNMPERVGKMVYFYFGIMYLSLLFACWGWIRALDNWEFWIFLMLAGTFLSDTGAYVTGHLIGRHKMAPGISPGKTVEGLFGGWIVALASAFVVRFIFWPSYPVKPLLIIITLIAFVGPLGDLSESMIKRGVNAKDSGNLIPGHGGLLDRVDALLFTGPVVYYFAKYFS